MTGPLGYASSSPTLEFTYSMAFEPKQPPIGYRQYIFNTDLEGLSILNFPDQTPVFFIDSGVGTETSSTFITNQYPGFMNYSVKSHAITISCNLDRRRYVYIGQNARTGFLAANEGLGNNSFGIGNYIHPSQSYSPSLNEQFVGYVYELIAFRRAISDNDAFSINALFTARFGTGLPT